METRTKVIPQSEREEHANAREEFRLFEKLFLQWVVVKNKTKNITETPDLVKLLKVSGAEPDLPTYNRLITKLMFKGKHDDVKHVSNLRKKHSKFKPVQESDEAYVSELLNARDPQYAATKDDMSLFEKLFLQWSQFVHGTEEDQACDSSSRTSVGSRSKERRGRSKVRSEPRPTTDTTIREESVNSDRTSSRRPLDVMPVECSNESRKNENEGVKLTRGQIETSSTNDIKERFDHVTSGHETGGVIVPEMVSTARRTSDIAQVTKKNDRRPHVAGHDTTKAATATATKRHGRRSRSGARDQRMTGTIVSVGRNFCFVKPSDGGEDVFFPNSTDHANFVAVREGDDVEFSRIRCPQGQPRARSLSIVPSKTERLRGTICNIVDERVCFVRPDNGDDDCIFHHPHAVKHMKLVRGDEVVFDRYVCAEKRHRAFDVRIVKRVRRERIRGTVSFVHDRFSIVRPEDGGDEVYFHNREDMSSFVPLHAGDEVEFDRYFSGGRPRACDLTIATIIDSGLKGTVVRVVPGKYCVVKPKDGGRTCFFYHPHTVSKLNLAEGDRVVFDRYVSGEKHRAIDVSFDAASSFSPEIGKVSRSV